MRASNRKKTNCERFNGQVKMNEIPQGKRLYVGRKLITSQLLQ